MRGSPFCQCIPSVCPSQTEKELMPLCLSESVASPITHALFISRYCGLPHAPDGLHLQTPTSSPHTHKYLGMMLYRHKPKPTSRQAPCAHPSINSSGHPRAAHPAPSLAKSLPPSLRTHARGWLCQLTGQLDRQLKSLAAIYSPCVMYLVLSICHLLMWWWSCCWCPQAAARRSTRRTRHSDN